MPNQSSFPPSGQKTTLPQCGSTSVQPKLCSCFDQKAILPESRLTCVLGLPNQRSLRPKATLLQSVLTCVLELSTQGLFLFRARASSPLSGYVSDPNSVPLLEAKSNCTPIGFDMCLGAPQSKVFSSFGRQQFDPRPV